MDVAEAERRYLEAAKERMLEHKDDWGHPDFDAMLSIAEANSTEFYFWFRGGGDFIDVVDTFQGLRHALYDDGAHTVFFTDYKCETDYGDIQTVALIDFHRVAYFDFKEADYDNTVVRKVLKAITPNLQDHSWEVDESLLLNVHACPLDSDFIQFLATQAPILEEMDRAMKDPIADGNFEEAHNRYSEAEARYHTNVKEYIAAHGKVYNKSDLQSSVTMKGA